MPLAVGIVDVGADAGEADFLPLGHVGSAADHFHLVGAGGDGAETETVGIGVRADGSDAADIDLAPAAGFLHLPNLHASHGQPVGQFVGGNVHVDVLPEPAKGNFHTFTWMDKIDRMFFY